MELLRLTGGCWAMRCLSPSFKEEALEEGGGWGPSEEVMLLVAAGRPPGCLVFDLKRKAMAEAGRQYEGMGGSQRGGGQGGMNG